MSRASAAAPPSSLPPSPRHASVSRRPAAASAHGPAGAEHLVERARLELSLADHSDELVVQARDGRMVGVAEQHGAGLQVTTGVGQQRLLVENEGVSEV